MVLMKNKCKNMVPGKVEWGLLENALKGAVESDPGVVSGPAKGMDGAVIDLGDWLLVTTTDPITLAQGDTARYVVNVNANDIAVFGARPRWFQAVLLLPERTTTPAYPGEILLAIRKELAELGAVLVGGHTEVTAGLDRPIVVGQMMGQVRREALVRPDGARAGDALLLAGGTAIEATALVAKELRGRLLDEGMSKEELDEAAAYLEDPGISVVAPALAAAATGVVNAMHDITEGGVVTAAEELGAGCGKGVVLDASSLPLTTLTKRVLGLAGMDPLGSIGSGGLLITCSEKEVPTVSRAVELTGRVCKQVGNITSEPGERTLLRGGCKQPWPEFLVDEWARVSATL